MRAIAFASAVIVLVILLGFAYFRIRQLWSSSRDEHWDDFLKGLRKPSKESPREKRKDDT